MSSGIPSWDHHCPGAVIQVAAGEEVGQCNKCRRIIVFARPIYDCPEGEHSHMGANQDAHSANTAEMRQIVIRTIEHNVYEYVVDVPAELADADYSDLHEWMDEDGWPDGAIRETTLVEIIDVRSV